MGRLTVYERFKNNRNKYQNVINVVAFLLYWVIPVTCTCIGYDQISRAYLLWSAGILLLDENKVTKTQAWLCAFPITFWIWAANKSYDRKYKPLSRNERVKALLDKMD